MAMNGTAARVLTAALLASCGGGTDPVLRANAVYSVFLVGRHAAPTAIVRRDR
jgi:hypothetical protein